MIYEDHVTLKTEVMLLKKNKNYEFRFCNSEKKKILEKVRIAWSTKLEKVRITRCKVVIGKNSDINK